MNAWQFVLVECNVTPFQILYQMRTCLLIFLDIASGKSSKLLHAFQELSRNNAEEGKGSARVGVDTKMSQSGHELQLGRNDVMKLFRCFLLSISTC